MNSPCLLKPGPKHTLQDFDPNALQPHLHKIAPLYSFSFSSPKIHNASDQCIEGIYSNPQKQEKASDQKDINSLPNCLQPDLKHQRSWETSKGLIVLNGSTISSLTISKVWIMLNRLRE